VVTEPTLRPRSTAPPAAGADANAAPPPSRDPTGGSDANLDETVRRRTAPHSRRSAETETCHRCGHAHGLAQLRIGHQLNDGGPTRQAQGRLRPKRRSHPSLHKRLLRSRPSPREIGLKVRSFGEDVGLLRPSGAAPRPRRVCATHSSKPACSSRLATRIQPRRPDQSTAPSNTRRVHPNPGRPNTVHDPQISRTTLNGSFRLDRHPGGR
jgi:hypothetical protein